MLSKIINLFTSLLAAVREQQRPGNKKKSNMEKPANAQLSRGGAGAAGGGGRRGTLRC